MPPRRRAQNHVESRGPVSAADRLPGRECQPCAHAARRHPSAGELRPLPGKAGLSAAKAAGGPRSWPCRGRAPNLDLRAGSPRELPAWTVWGAPAAPWASRVSLHPRAAGGPRPSSAQGSPPWERPCAAAAPAARSRGSALPDFRAPSRLPNLLPLACSHEPCYQPGSR